MMRVLKVVTGAKGLLPLLIGLCIWQFTGPTASALFPPPLTWLDAMARLIDTGNFFPALTATLTILLVGLAAASFVGFILGVLIGILPAFRQWTGLLLEYLRAVPPPVVIPIAVLMLGYTGIMKVTMIGLAAFWPVMLNTVSGVSQIRGLTLDVARAFRLSWFDTLLKIVIPATIPSLLLGMRVALPQALVVTLVLEMFTGELGIGSLMVAAQRNFDASEVFGLLTVMGVFGYCLTMIFDLVERGILRRWPTSA
jgi:ABC-type nitrate/sulfonate/bicarbonate transport system permease component